MSRSVRAVWDNTYGLLVDDGQLAVGTILSLAVTWIVTRISTSEIRENAGWVLLTLVVVLVLVNLQRAGRNVARWLR